MSTCLTYSPREESFGYYDFRPEQAESLLNFSLFTGLSGASEVLRSQTQALALANLDALSFHQPIALRFQNLAEEWKQDTRFCSSPEIASSHPAYKRIIGMGPPAVTLILREMQREPGLWFDALMAITGEQPVRQENAGNIEAMCADWIAWGRKNGLK